MYKITKILLYIVFYYIVAIPYVIAQKNYLRSVVPLHISNNLVTAFYIGEGRFVTNFHAVIGDSVVSKIFSLKNLPINLLNNYITIGDFNIDIKKIIHLDAINDLAVVQIDLKQVPILEQYITPLKVAKNTTLNKKLEYKIIAIDYSHKSSPIRQEIKLKYQNLKKEKNDTFIELYTYIIQSGMSGSPLLVENKVHGILYGSSEYKSFIIDASYLEVLLKKTPLNCSNYLCIKREIQILKNKSKNNDPKAQYALGLIYLYSKGVLNNVLEAINLFKQADQKNNIDAQIILGSIYWYNKFIKRDAEQSIYFTKRASQQHNVDSKILLGNIYHEKGEFKTSNFWFQQASEIDKKYQDTALNLNKYNTKLITTSNCSKAFLK